MTLPKVNRVVTKEKGKFALDHLSASSLIKFSTNPILFKMEAMNGDYVDTLQRSSGILGKAYHHALFVYYGGSDEHPVSNESEAIKAGLEAGTQYVENYNENFIEFTSTLPNKQKIIEKVVFLFQEYVKQYPFDPKREKIVSLEESYKEFISVEWKGQHIVLPIPLKARIDKIYDDEDQELCIEDYKSVHSFSNPDKIDGAKIIQAIEYYFIAYAVYGRQPKSAVNGEAVFVPNVNALFDNEVAMIAYIHRLDEPDEVAKEMKRLKVENITDLLREKLHKSSSIKMFEKTLEEKFKTYKSIDYSKMNIEEKIQTKLMEFGILVNFHEKVEGHSVTQYRYNPSMGVKMKTLNNHVKDIEQITGVSGIRILAPVPNTTFVGFEVPKKERTFVEGTPETSGFDIAIGVDLMGAIRRFDLRESPHMLIAGATGSGKSVFVNSLITQLQQVKNAELHLFDPKLVELAVYEGGQRVREYETDAETIYDSLRSLVSEMNKRYDRMKDKGVRKISDYTGRMSYKFVFIDEYGDLIAAQHEKKEWVNTGEVYQIGEKKGMPKQKLEVTNISKEIERMVLLLAQKARGAGIHLIISTQRPSVNILSGSIKNNFPTKVAFRMANTTDSIVAIDQPGAEALLGKGDMLFIADKGVERLQGYNV